MQPSSTLNERSSFFDRRRSSFWYISWGVIALSSVIRILWYPVVVSDYTYFGKPWFDALRSHAGLTAFAEPFADYAPMYLYLLKILTVIPVSSLYSEKTLSLLFDVLIAGAAYLMLKRTSIWRTRSDIAFLCAAALFALPTVMMNSSLWGQTDALYGFGVVASLFFILTDAPFLAALSFGFAISLKLQAIFFAPVVIGYLARKRETWKYLIVPPSIYVLSMLPAWIGGGQLRYWLFIYLAQAHEYPWLSVSAQSAFAFLQPLPLSMSATNAFFWLGIAAAAACAAFITHRMQNTPVLTARTVILMSLASVLIIPYLLPRMHERYFYVADLIAVLYAFYRRGRWLVPLVVVGTSLISYMPFLYKQVSFLSWAHVDLRVPALLLLIPIGIVINDLRARK